MMKIDVAEYEIMQYNKSVGNKPQIAARQQRRRRVNTMANEKKAKKAAAPKRVAKPIDEKTGYREGSLGFAIGRAYLGETKHEKAVEAVEEVIKASAKAKGKPTNEEYVHGRAVSWIGFLKTRAPKTYTDLPKAEKPKPAAKEKAAA